MTELNANERLALPGSELHTLEPLLGDWQVKLMLRTSAEAIPLVATECVAHRKWILEGRYLQETMTGKLAGRSFQRVALLTYNNLLQRYECQTMDSLDTGFMSYAGIGQDGGNTINLYGSFTQAGYEAEVIGKTIRLRYVWQWSSPIQNVVQLYFALPAEQEFLASDISYTRK